MKRSDAARCTAWPPSTEPVKATKSTASLLMMLSVSACERCSTWNTPLGRPAAEKPCAKRSATSGVCAECLRITALPASRAGTMALTAVEIRVVPGRHDEDHAQRLVAHEAGEPLLGLDLHVGERPGGGADHVARALGEAADFAGRVADRPAHLTGEFLRDLRPARLHGLDEARADRGALGHGHVAPRHLRVARGAQGGFDLGGAGEMTFGDDRSVDGRDGSQIAHATRPLRCGSWIRMETIDRCLVWFCKRHFELCVSPISAAR